MVKVWPSQAMWAADGLRPSTTTSLSADAARALEAGLWRFSVRMRRGLDDDAERARLRLAVDEQGVPPRLQRLAALDHQQLQPAHQRLRAA